MKYDKPKNKKEIESIDSENELLKSSNTPYQKQYEKVKIMKKSPGIF